MSPADKLAGMPSSSPPPLCFLSRIRAQSSVFHRVNRFATLPLGVHPGARRGLARTVRHRQLTERQVFLSRPGRRATRFNENSR
jgi:hypothetical protein